MRQLALVLVNVPDELMYWPAAFTIADLDPLHRLVVLGPAADEDLPSVNAVPSIGASRVSFSTGGRSPG